jgi:rubrerythrin
MATRGVDFAKLSVMDALDLAILIEEEARDRYEELADQLKLHHTRGAASFFRKMIKVEDHHRQKLADRRKSSFGDRPVRVTREMIFDVEAPEYDEVRAGMSPREALKTALHAEIKAHDFFAAALRVVKDADVKALFEELREEEIQHQQWVRMELAGLPSGSEPEGDPSDEPVAQ